MTSPPIEPDRARLAANVAAVLERLREAERRSGRSGGSTRLLAVVKRIPDPVVAALLELGHADVAENRVQALGVRAADLRERARFHLIGHLQSNKVRPALEGFHSFHGLDSLRLARRLSDEAVRQARTWPVYLQVNLGREPQKHGCLPEDLESFAAGVAPLPGLELVGLMGMAPFVEEAETARPLFDDLRERSEELRRRGVLPATADGLSMGMSNDFEVAAECGATIVRVGSALFEGMLAHDESPG